MYSADKPIRTCDEDLLCRSDFAHQLAEAIVKLSSTDTFVVGLYGEWGSGKTSVLNLTEEVIGNISGKDNNPKVTLIRFNPWGYTDGTQLVQQYFSVLSNAVQSDTSGNKRKAIGEALEKYSFILNYLRYIPVVGPFLSEVPELASKIGSQLKEGVLSNENNIQIQKEAVIKALASFHRKIVIFIDDIDRLPNDQIRMIFQLVNSVADFPNITYVLSFDKNVVVRALRDVQNCIGEEYLKKIIQFPVSLPEISGDSLFEILQQEIKNVYSGTNQDLFEKDHWNNVLVKCVYPFIHSIRDLRRYINTLRFKYLPLENNINPSDFAGITALEVFEHQIYEWIISKQEILTKPYIDDQPYNSSAREREKENWCSAHKDICISLPETILEAIIILFPMYAARFDMPFETLDSNEFNRLLRICSNQRFEKYFTLSLGNALLSHTTRNLSYTTYNKLELANYINELIKSNSDYQYLQDTLISIKSISDEKKPLLSEILFDYIGTFSMQNKEMSFSSSYTLCLSLLSSLLKSLPDEKTRLSIFQPLIEQSSEANLFASAQLIHNMEVALGRFGSTTGYEDKIVFSAQNIESVEQCFMQRINTLPDKSKILESEHLPFIDYLWKNIDPVGYATNMKSLFATPINILLFTSNKAQRSVNLFDLSKSWSYDIERDFTAFISVSDVREVIDSHNFSSQNKSLSDETVTRLAAFYLYTQDTHPDSMMTISNSDAEKLALKWMENRS